MEIFFIRHPETTKNVGEHSFSSDNDDEMLTAGGRQEAAMLVAAMSESGRLSGARIVSSPNHRAAGLAQRLANATGWGIEVDTRLAPRHSGAHAGLPESQVAREDPQYFQALSLYRSGVLSAYSIPRRGEPIRDFEARVTAGLLEREEKYETGTLVVFAHRSTITAALMWYARRFHGSHQDHYGYVELALLSVSAVSIEDGEGEIRYAGRVPFVASVNDGGHRVERLIEW